MTVDSKKIWEILKSEYRLYQELYQLAQQKQDIIIAEDLDGLEEIVKREEKFLEEIHVLEEARLQPADNNADNSMDISQTSLVDEPDREEFEDLRNHLVALTVKLREQNLLNNKLIDDSLSLLNMKMNLIRGSGGANTYSKEGLVKKTESTFINRRA